MVDAPGNPLCLLPGPRAGCGRAGELLAAAAGTGNVLADKEYYTNQVVKLVAATGAGLVIPSKKNRLVEQVIDHSSYSDRNKVERFFSRLKQFRRLATRYGKTTSSFLGILHFVSALLWLR
jgi:putative transposase